ncbi:MAG: hypothetical protein HQL82_16720 [Magnetococcales bacterium]|nr:hypothetical protein [Magnetococcales bacterium]
MHELLRDVRMLYIQVAAAGVLLTLVTLLAVHLPTAHPSHGAGGPGLRPEASGTGGLPQTAGSLTIEEGSLLADRLRVWLGEKQRFQKDNGPALMRLTTADPLAGQLMHHLHGGERLLQEVESRLNGAPGPAASGGEVVADAGLKPSAPVEEDSGTAPVGEDVGTAESNGEPAETRTDPPEEESVAAAPLAPTQVPVTESAAGQDRAVPATPLPQPLARTPGPTQAGPGPDAVGAAFKARLTAALTKGKLALTLEQEDNGLVLYFPSDFNFDKGGTRVTAPARAGLTRLTLILREVLSCHAKGAEQTPACKTAGRLRAVVVEGHALGSPVGTKRYRYNWSLAQQRATGVYQLMLALWPGLGELKNDQNHTLVVTRANVSARKQDPLSRGFSLRFLFAGGAAE